MSRSLLLLISNQQGDHSTSHSTKLQPEGERRSSVEPQAEEEIDMEIAKLVNTKSELDPTLTETTEEPMKIHIWDFAGQELYYTTHQVIIL